MRNSFIKKLENNENLHLEKNAIVGKIQGYYVTISQPEHQKKAFNIYINAVQPENSSTPDLQSFLDDLKTENKRAVYSASYEDQNIHISGMETVPFKSAPSRINKILEPIFFYLKKYNYTTGCAVCGVNTPEVSHAIINTSHLYLCNTCYQNEINQLEETKQELFQQPSNPVLGTLGAIVGAVLGGAVWVIIAQLGYMAAISAVAPVFLAFGGYKLLAKKVNLTGLIICLVVAAIALYGAIHFDWTLYLKNYYTELGYPLTWPEAYEEFKYLMSNEPEFAENVRMDYLWGGIAFLIGGVIGSITMYRKEMGFYTASKE